MMTIPRMTAPVWVATKVMTVDSASHCARSIEFLPHVATPQRHRGTRAPAEDRPRLDLADLEASEPVTLTHVLERSRRLPVQAEPLDQHQGSLADVHVPLSH